MLLLAFLFCFGGVSSAFAEPAAPVDQSVPADEAGGEGLSDSGVDGDSVDFVAPHFHWKHPLTFSFAPNQTPGLFQSISDSRVPKPPDWLA